MGWGEGEDFAGFQIAIRSSRIMQLRISEGNGLTINIKNAQGDWEPYFASNSDREFTSPNQGRRVFEDNGFNSNTNT